MKRLHPAAGDARTVAATKPRRRRLSDLSDEDLAEMLALSAGADSVELKLTVPEADHRSAVAALGLDPLHAQIRLVSFFDTPDLKLNQQGVIVARGAFRAARTTP